MNLFRNFQNNLTFQILDGHSLAKGWQRSFYNHESFCSTLPPSRLVAFTSFSRLQSIALPRKLSLQLGKDSNLAKQPFWKTVEVGGWRSAGDSRCQSGKEERIHKPTGVPLPPECGERTRLRQRQPPLCPPTSAGSVPARARPRQFRGPPRGGPRVWAGARTRQAGILKERCGGSAQSDREVRSVPPRCSAENVCNPSSQHRDLALRP